MILNVEENMPQVEDGLRSPWEKPVIQKLYLRDADTSSANFASDDAPGNYS